MSALTRARLLALAQGATQFGDSFTLTPSLSGGPIPFPGVSKRVVQLDGDAGDNSPWTVTMSGPIQPFGTSTIPTAPNGIGKGPDLFCRVQWGAGGVFHLADIDWLTGGTFVVHGQSVSVDVIYPFFPGASNVLGTVKASLTPGVRRGGNWPPQRTIRFNENGTATPGVIGPTLNATVIIPPFARKVRVSYVGTQLATRTINQLDAAGNIIAQLIYGASAARAAPPYPEATLWDIVRNASAIQCVNNDAALTLSQVQAIFDLDL